MTTPEFKDHLTMQTTLALILTLPQYHLQWWSPVTVTDITRCRYPQLMSMTVVYTDQTIINIIHVISHSCVETGNGRYFSIKTFGLTRNFHILPILPVCDFKYSTGMGTEILSSTHAKRYYRMIGFRGGGN